jgi:hypothetical protein
MNVMRLSVVTTPNYSTHESKPVRSIVEQKLTTALILEDDVDWDLRIKFRMTDVARAARLLVHPVTNTPDEYLDQKHPRPKADQSYTDFNLADHTTHEPVDSPYGDLSRWDLFWLGNCGSRFPDASDVNAPSAESSSPTTTQPPSLGT